MAVVTRPYFMTYKGQQHMVEATSPAAAVKHIVGADITELRPARGSEVNAWHKAGRAIPTAGDKTAAPIAGQVETNTRSTTEPDPVFDRDDATRWLLENGMTETGMSTWTQICSEQRLTLMHFDVLRIDSPEFGEAMAYGEYRALPRDGVMDAKTGIDEVRALLENEPLSLDDVIEAIGDAKRRELFLPEDSAPTT